MGLTKEHLVNLRDQAVAKRQEYITLVNQANGAIDILNMLIDEVNKPDAGETNGFSI